MAVARSWGNGAWRVVYVHSFSFARWKKIWRLVAQQCEWTCYWTVHFKMVKVVNFYVHLPQVLKKTFHAMWYHKSDSLFGYKILTSESALKHDTAYVRSQSATLSGEGIWGHFWFHQWSTTCEMHLLRLGQMLLLPSIKKLMF